MFYNKLSAHLAVRHLDVALPSVLTTRYCIPQEWQSVLHQICSTKNPFDLRCESVTLGIIWNHCFSKLQLMPNHWLFF